MSEEYDELGKAYDARLIGRLWQYVRPLPRHLLGRAPASRP
jgi:hypothetical protein